MCVCVLSHFSHVWLFVTPWTVTRQVPLSMGFSRQEYWSGLFVGEVSHKPNNLLGYFFLKNWTIQLKEPCVSNTMLKTLFISIFLALSSCLFSRASADMSELCDSLSAFLVWIYFPLTSSKGAWWHGGDGGQGGRHASWFSSPNFTGLTNFQCGFLHTSSTWLHLTWCVTFS